MLQHILALVMSLAGVRRFLTFGVVGIGGIGVNTGILLALQWLGFDALTWPIWAATELAILWSYNLNRRFTWRERAYGRWWLYNVAALFSSLVAIQASILLVLWMHAALWLGSIGGILVSMVMNYLFFDKVVFASLSWLAIQLGTPALKRALFDGTGPTPAVSARSDGPGH